MAFACECGPAPGGRSWLPAVARVASGSPGDPRPRPCGSGCNESVLCQYSVQRHLRNLVLPRAQRLTHQADFQQTIRHGVRAGRPAVVVHALLTEGLVTRCGFVVGKSVGIAVVRNRVRRRLRNLTAELLAGAPRGSSWVVRALPAAAESPAPELALQLKSAWKSAVNAMQRLPKTENEKSTQQPGAARPSTSSYEPSQSV